jgi:hypothetical protein
VRDNLQCLTRVERDPRYADVVLSTVAAMKLRLEIAGITIGRNLSATIDPSTAVTLRGSYECGSPGRFSDLDLVARR